MNKKVLRVVSVIAGLTTVISSFSGCKDSKKETLQNEINNDFPPVTLTFDWPGYKPDDCLTVLKQVEEKCPLNIKLKFNYSHLTSKNISIYEDSIEDMINSSKSDVDAFVTSRNTNQTLDYYQQAQSGCLKDITELLSKYAPDINKSLSPQDLEANKINGKLYYIPSLFPQADCLSVAVNQDLMKKYNIPPIKNFDDYDAYLKIIKQNEPSLNPGVVKISNLYTIEQTFNYVLLDENSSLVYDYNDPTMKLIPWEQTTAFKQVVDYFTKWTDSKYIMPEQTNSQQFASAIIDNPVEGPTSVNIASSNSTITKMNFYNYPLYADKPLLRINPVNNTDIGVVAINSKSKNAERVLMFLNWVEKDKDNYNLFMYGIEGKDYQTKNGSMVLPEGDKRFTSYTIWSKNPLLNLNFLQSGQTDIANVDDYRNVINSKSKYAPHDGFVPDYTKIQKQLNSRSKLILYQILQPINEGGFSTINAKLSFSMINGAESTEPLVTEIQRQLDAWNASKK